MLQDLAPGSTWGQFKILGKLGKGTFGSVYHAQDVFERDVALKLLDSPEAIREGKVLAHLKHPNIVGVLGYEQSVQGAALAMEFIQGQTLEQFVAFNGRLDPAYAAILGVKLCRALAMVHRKGLLHRDIKASNVMRQPDGRIVLIDFGLGQAMVKDVRASQIAGTLPYMAPELFEGNAASVATDLYAAGVLLFYLVSQQYPVTGDSYAAFQEAHGAKIRQHILDVRPDLDPEFAGVIETAIHPTPARRFRSAGSMITALEDVLRLHPKRRRWIWAWVAGLGALVTAGTALLTKQQPPPVQEEFRPDAQYTRVTKGENLNQDPMLSPDGTLLVYASDEAEPGNLDLRIRQVPDGVAIRLTHHPGIDWMPAFSPDSHSIAFRSERDGGGIYMIPSLGGKEQLIAPGGYAPRFSPDGKYIAYYTGELWHPKTPSARIYIIPVAGGPPQQVCPNMADARHPLWAPDSHHILFQGSQARNAPPDQGADWWIADLNCSAPENTGALSRFREQGLEVHTWSACWKDGSLIFSAAKKDNTNLWRAPISRQPPFKLGEPERLTSGAAAETSPSAASHGALAFVSPRLSLRIWSFLLRQNATSAENESNRITRTADLDAFPSVSSDEKYMAFTRTVSEIGIRQVWLKDLGSGEETQMTSDTQEKENPVISPDGDAIAFSMIEAGRKQEDIYVLNRKSRERRNLCSDCGTVTGWSRDGKSVLISVSGKIEALDIASGARKPLLARSGFYLDEAEWSPDGQWVAFSALGDSGERHIFFVKADGSGEWKPLLTSGKWSDKPHWSADGRTLYFYSNEDGFPCLWKRGFDQRGGAPSGPAHAVHHFHNAEKSPIHISQPARGFAVTARRIYCNLSEVSGAIWMSVAKK